MNNEKIKRLHTKYTQRPTQNTPRKKGIFEQIEEAFNEMASEFDEEEQNKTSSPKPSSKKKRFTVIKILKIKTEHPRGALKRFETKQSHTEKCLLKIVIQLHERSQSEKILKTVRRLAIKRII